MLNDLKLIIWTVIETFKKQIKKQIRIIFLEYLLNIIK